MGEGNIRVLPRWLANLICLLVHLVSAEAEEEVEVEDGEEVVSQAVLV